MHQLQCDQQPIARLSMRRMIRRVDAAEEELERRGLAQPERAAVSGAHEHVRDVAGRCLPERVVLDQRAVDHLGAHMRRHAEDVGLVDLRVLFGEPC